MEKAEVIKKILDCGIIPVVRAKSSEEALKIATALKDGEVACIEITMTVPGAVKLIKKLVEDIGKDIIIGAGTVLDADTAVKVIEAGAEFVVSPNLSFETIKICRINNKVCIPGALTPTEVVSALEFGADMIKIFPAGNVGGPSYIRALRGPLPQAKFVPTGGVDLQTAADFIKAGAAALGVGTALVDKNAIAEDKFEIITERAKEFVKIVKEARS